MQRHFVNFQVPQDLETNAAEREKFALREEIIDEMRTKCAELHVELTEDFQNELRKVRAELDRKIHEELCEVWDDK